MVYPGRIAVLLRGSGVRIADKQLLTVVLATLLGGVALAGCTTGADGNTEPPTPTHRSTGLPDEEPLPAPSLTAAEALVRQTAEELDAGLLPEGFFFVNVVDMDGGTTNAVYADAPAQEQGRMLNVYSGPSGDVGLLEGWREVPELSTDFAVSAGPSLSGATGTTVTIDASPAGVVRLMGDGVSEQELLDLAARLLGTA